MVSIFSVSSNFRTKFVYHSPKLCLNYLTSPYYKYCATSTLLQCTVHVWETFLRNERYQPKAGKLSAPSFKLIAEKSSTTWNTTVLEKNAILRNIDPILRNLLAIVAFIFNSKHSFFRSTVWGWLKSWWRRRWRGLKRLLSRELTRISSCLTREVHLILKSRSLRISRLICKRQIARWGTRSALDFFWRILVPHYAEEDNESKEQNAEHSCKNIHLSIPVVDPIRIIWIRWNVRIIVIALNLSKPFHYKVVTNTFPNKTLVFRTDALSWKAYHSGKEHQQQCLH